MNHSDELFNSLSDNTSLTKQKKLMEVYYTHGSYFRASSNRILAEAGVNPDTRVKDLTDEEVKKISTIIADSQVVEGDLRREIAMNIKRLQEIGCYRGIRHRKSLPVRGQKTKTNARTKLQVMKSESG